VHALELGREAGKQVGCVLEDEEVIALLATPDLARMAVENPSIAADSVDRVRVVSE
jgi:hypothetical protein